MVLSFFEKKFKYPPYNAKSFPVLFMKPGGCLKFLKYPKLAVLFASEFLLKYPKQAVL
jgi:hypothetical protein